MKLMRGAVGLAALLLILSGTLASVGGATATTSEISPVVGVVPLRDSLSAFGPVLDDSNGNLYISGDMGPLEPGVEFAVSGESNSVTATAPVGIEPGLAAVDPVNGDVYVPNLEAIESNLGDVIVLEGASLAVAATIGVGYNPSAAVFVPDSGNLFISNTNYDYGGAGGGNVSVISGTLNSVVATIPVGAIPTGVLYDTSNGDVYIQDQSPYFGTGPSLGPNHLTVVSGVNGTVITGISLGPDSSQIAFNPVDQDLYVGGTDGISVISSQSNAIIKNLSIPGGEPTFVNAQGEVYVLQAGNPARVSIISPTSNSVASTFTVGPAGAIAYDPLGGFLFTVVSGSDVVNVTSATTGSLVESINLGPGSYLPARQPVFDPMNGDLYVVQYGNTQNLVILSGLVSNPSGPPPATSTIVWLGVGCVSGAAVVVTLIVLRKWRTTSSKGRVP